MIDKDSLISVGYISRPHSFKGEIQLVLEREIASLKRGDFLFIQIQGKYIPYKVLETKGKSKEPVVKLEFITSFDQAKEICAHQVFIDREMVAEESESALIGYEIIDKQLGNIGIVEEVQTFPQQIMLLVMHNKTLKYIPLVDDFVEHISSKNQEIWLNLPEGLLDLQ